MVPPPGYDKFCVMREMKWTYQELMDCPLDVYLDILEFISIENKYAVQRQKNANK